MQTAIYFWDVFLSQDQSLLFHLFCPRPNSYTNGQLNIEIMPGQDMYNQTRNLALTTWHIQELFTFQVPYLFFHHHWFPWSSLVGCGSRQISQYAVLQVLLKALCLLWLPFCSWRLSQSHFLGWSETKETLLILAWGGNILIRHSSAFSSRTSCNETTTPRLAVRPKTCPWK